VSIEKKKLQQYDDTQSPQKIRRGVTVAAVSKQKR